MGTPIIPEQVSAKTVVMMVFLKNGKLKGNMSKRRSTTRPGSEGDLTRCSALGHVPNIDTGVCEVCGFNPKKGSEAGYKRKQKKEEK